ncbi:aspartic peptidase domain-containing protein [Kockiozyma suomiensis]|uniref:aspartic peptidase domain-containing protein n=1 Tax=Kockiozyma suomiensis TaxID=1337062 RepID=UPI003342F9E5
MLLSISSISILFLLLSLLHPALAAVPYYGNDAPDAPVVAKVALGRHGGRVYSADSVANLKRFRSLLKASLSRYSRTKRELQGNRVVRKAVPLSDKLAPIGNDGTFFANLKLGSPAQDILFDIDMTSSDFWVESTTSIHGTRFRSENSQSYFSDSRFVFRDCVGSSETLEIGESKFAIDFAHCTPHPSTVRTLNPSGGMLGIAHSSLSQTGLPHFFETAVGAEKLSDAIFAIEYIHDDPTSGAVLSIGGVAHKSDDPLYAPVKTFGFWQMLFKSLMVDGNTVIDNIQGVIDINSPFILAPAEDVRMFYDAISGAQPLSDGFWSYPCFEDPKIHIEHAGWLFPIKDASLGKVKEASGYCVGPLVEADLAGLWVIGEPFLRGVLSVFDFDQKRIGFRTAG